MQCRHASAWPVNPIVTAHLPSNTVLMMLLQEPTTQLEQRSRRRERAPEIPTHDAVPLTAAAWRALQRQLRDLREQKRREIPARLRIAREFGASANNDEYFAIREEEAVLDARIARLEGIVTRATVVEPVAGHDVVAVGSEVVVVDLDTGEEHDYLLDTPHGALGPTHVSARSPVGRALLGRKSGERLRIRVPNGRVRELELRESRAPRGA